MKNTITSKKLSSLGNSLICPVAVLERDGKILNGFRNYTSDKWKEVSVWTLPGGRCEDGETLEEALRREVTEEVGIIDLTIDDFIGEVAGAKEGDIVPVFFCKTSQDFKLMEPEKFSKWCWVVISEYISEECWTGINRRLRNMVVDYLLKLHK